jgi:hypothetical protein
MQLLSGESYDRVVEISCADCGCMVSRGERLVPCDTTECCCLDLPIRRRTPDEIAELLRAAFASKDLVLFGRLLADDARWGDDDNPNKCRSRSDVVAIFARLLGEGVDGHVTEAASSADGVALRLHVDWPNPGEGREIDLYQAYLVADGLITEIQRHDDRRSALAAVSSSGRLGVDDHS